MGGDGGVKGNRVISLLSQLLNFPPADEEPDWGVGCGLRPILRITVREAKGGVYGVDSKVSRLNGT